MSGPAAGHRVEVRPRTTKVLLFQGEDRQRFEELLAEVQREAAPGPKRIADTAAADAVEAYNAFIDEAQERAVTVLLRALGRTKWRAMVAEHTRPVKVKRPVTEKREAPDGAVVETSRFVEVEEDQLDEPGFAPVLVAASMLEPGFDTAVERDEFLDALSDADFSRLYTAAWVLNQSSGVVDPKPLNVSDLTPSSDET
ncbi:MAG TPA: hypothetical protein VFL94_02120 [Actinomycetales bacterium]|nr:hypothetical protein [Actinomycetales bacterium]